MSIDSADFRDLIYAVAGRTRFRPAIIEKDYYLTVILNSLNDGLSDRIVFKGETLLNKIYLPMRRLSEDLDFSHEGEGGLDTRAKRSRALEPIRVGMRRFLEALGLHSDKPEGEGFNNSTQYLFLVNYPSFVTTKEESIKIEISLRLPPLKTTVKNSVSHFFQDSFTGEDLLPNKSIRSLSYDEAVAEKLRAAVARRDVTVRDCYDLKEISSAGFDFLKPEFTALFHKKLEEVGYRGDFRQRLGRSEREIDQLRRQVATDLLPVIRAEEEFDIDAVLGLFNTILSDKAYSRNGKEE